MNKEGYQPLKNKKDTKIIPPNVRSHVRMKENGYTWEDIDRSYWEGFDTAKNNMGKRIAELEKINAELKDVANKLFDEWCRGEDPCPHLKKRDEQLTKAKALLKEWIIYRGGTREFHSALQDKTEEFLKEVEE